jgi:hypothetical protein
MSEKLLLESHNFEGLIMAGQIKHMIDEIITKRSKGNPTIASTTKTKLILKGINPDKYTALSEDDPLVIKKLRELAKELI